MIIRAVKPALAAVALALAIPALSQQSNVAVEVVEESDGTSTLIHEAVIDAPPGRVWATLSTVDGWKMWGPQFAQFDLRIGGSIETAYHADATAGDDRNIRHRILALVPERMIALKVEQVPAGGPVDPALLENIWAVYELEPLADGTTQLRISGLGYGNDDASQQLLGFFKSGNVYSIELLQKNLAAANEPENRRE